mgnify:CR=1 FL=1
MTVPRRLLAYEISSFGAMCMDVKLGEEVGYLSGDADGDLLIADLDDIAILPVFP